MKQIVPIWFVSSYLHGCRKHTGWNSSICIWQQTYYTSDILW